MRVEAAAGRGSVGSPQNAAARAPGPQVHERNSGRDPFPVFVRRGPLPREKPRGVSLTGRFPKSLCYRCAAAARVCRRGRPCAQGSGSSLSHSSPTGRPAGPASPRAPSAEDLRIGATVNVHGRAFLLYDCDTATRAWYTVGRAEWAFGGQGEGG
jgi:hypothetical protein